MKIIPILLMFALCLGCGGDDEPPAPLQCPSEPGPEVDLALYARLTATATRDDSVFGWVRESQDALSTVRDSTPATSWKIPVDTPTIVEVDLQPWLGRPTSLDRLELGFVGPQPVISIELLNGCGGQILERIPWPGGATELDLGGRCAACLQLRVEAEEETALESLRLLSRDASIEVPEVDLEQIDPPVSRFQRSGAIEGFYGIPWSWRERRQMVLALAAAGLDTYLYAPKHDELHRSRWREPYPPAEQAELVALATLGRQVGVTFYLGISPFLDFDSSSDEDYEVLRDKLTLFLNGGFDGVAVLADDIEMGAEVTVDADLGRAQVEVVNRLVADLREVNPEVRLLFVPTAYSDNRVARFLDGPGYLEALAVLDDQVGVMWTGLDTFCESMIASDMDQFLELVGRPPVIWDNYWANDATDLFTGNLLLASLEGRSEDLPEAVEGLAFNLSIQGAPSRLMAALAAWYMTDPGPPDPDEARAFAAEVETTFSAGAASDRAREAELLRLVMTLYDGHGARETACVPLSEGVAALRDVLESGGELPLDQVAPLLSLFGRMATLGDAVHHSGLEADLVDDLIFPLEKARFEGEAGLWTLALLGERLAGRQGEEAREAARGALDASRASRYRLGSGEVQGLFNEVSGLTPEEGGLVCPEPGQLPSTCRVGESASFSPFRVNGGAQVTLEVFGLPGATVDGATVSFTPGYAGRFRGVAVILSRGDRPGWAFRELTLVCRDDR
jgi:hypothetical protein